MKIDTEAKARKYIQQWSQEVQIKTETYGNKNRIVDSNPGFETVIFNEMFPEATYLSVIMQNINNIIYSCFKYLFTCRFCFVKKIDIEPNLLEKVQSLCKKDKKT